MLLSVVAILLLGFFAGQIARRLGLPPLLGMIGVGIALGPEGGNVLSPEVLEAATALRSVAVTVILMKAGLGLDREKLAQQGTVAIRLGFLPGLVEAIVVALLSIVLFNFDFLTGLLMGFIVGAESPAVIVPGMLWLKSLGWGVRKGIPDAILAGSALPSSLLLFSLLLNFLTRGNVGTVKLPGGVTLTALQFLPVQVFLEVALGIGFGYVAAHMLVSLLTRQTWTQTAGQDILVTFGVALFLVVLPENFPYFSGYLAVMTMGFFLVQLNAPLGRRLRNGFDSLWGVAEIVLFVMMGVSIQLQTLGAVLLPGLLLLTVSVLVGRTIGWLLSTWGSNWIWREKLFLLPGYSAKATVQAALGALPLSRGVPGGEVILAIAALSILTTAPLGAWAIPTFAPKLLEKGEVDPTKVTVTTAVRFLAAVDTSILAPDVLTKAADLARRSDAEVIVLHVCSYAQPEAVIALQQQTQRSLADIRHQFILVEGTVAEAIVRTAQDYQVTDIVMGKRGHQHWEEVLIGSVSQAVLETSTVPVILVESRKLKR